MSTRRCAAFFLCVLFSSACAARATVDSQPESTVLYVGPTFLTNDPDIPQAEAVLVDGQGRILRIFHERGDAPPHVPVKKLPGALAVPGLHDAHVHLEALGQKLDGLDLSGVRSRTELREKVAAYIRANPDVAAVRGFGWDQNRFPDQRFPSRADIDGLTDKPVFLLRTDGHAVLVNTELLEAAGIDGGLARSDAKVFADENGEPTGVLLDSAVAAVEAMLPPPTRRERKAWLRTALHTLADAGVTAAHDMGMFAPVMDALFELQEEEGLPLDVYAYLAGTDIGWLMRHAVTHPFAGPEGRRHIGRVHVQGVKLMIDGAMGSRGAWFFEPYDDDPHNSGHPAFPLALQRWVFALAQQAGWQVAVHAIGDRANDLALRWVESEQRPGNLPTRVEHAQVVREADFVRFAKAGAVASMQPVHVADDWSWADRRIGLARAEGAYGWRSHLAAYGVAAFGSDAPVADHRPVMGIATALSRTDGEGNPAGGWKPAQRLTLQEAVWAYTAGAAAAVGRAHELGALAEGKRFDVTVFRENCGESAECWRRNAALATVVDGRLRRTDTEVR